jgi:hypothetical protein
MTAEEIRDRYLSQLRSLYRLVRKLERLYRDFPDASADAWRTGVVFPTADS